MSRTRGLPGFAEVLREGDPGCPEQVPRRGLGIARTAPAETLCHHVDPPVRGLVEQRLRRPKWFATGKGFPSMRKSRSPVACGFHGRVWLPFNYLNLMGFLSGTKSSVWHDGCIFARQGNLRTACSDGTGSCTGLPGRHGMVSGRTGAGSSKKIHAALEREERN